MDTFGPIGIASMEADGTLKLDLRRNIETRFNFHKVLRIAKDHPRYQQYLDQIGGISPGDHKSIPAWSYPATSPVLTAI